LSAKKTCHYFYTLTFHSHQISLYTCKLYMLLIFMPCDDDRFEHLSDVLFFILVTNYLNFKH